MLFNQLFIFEVSEMSFIEQLLRLFIQFYIYLIFLWNNLPPHIMLLTLDAEPQSSVS